MSPNYITWQRRCSKRPQKSVKQAANWLHPSCLLHCIPAADCKSLRQRQQTEWAATVCQSCQRISLRMPGHLPLPPTPHLTAGSLQPRQTKKGTWNKSLTSTPTEWLCGLCLPSRMRVVPVSADPGERGGGGPGASGWRQMPHLEDLEMREIEL